MASTRREFFTSKPSNQAVYTTLEIYNANAGLHRFVSKQQLPKSFTLESDAPRNGGEVVEFEPVGFEAPEPEQGEDGMFMDVQLGAIGFEARKYLKAVFDSWPPTIDLIWRQYFEGVTEPVQVFYFQVASPSIENVSVAMRAEQVNRAAQDVSRTYDGDDFPGLRGSI